jgi:hypothetical protein
LKTFEKLESPGLRWLEGIGSDLRRDRHKECTIAVKGRNLRGEK